MNRKQLRMIIQDECGSTTHLSEDVIYDIVDDWNYFMELTRDIISFEVDAEKQFQKELKKKDQKIKDLEIEIEDNAYKMDYLIEYREAREAKDKITTKQLRKEAEAYGFDINFGDWKESMAKIKGERDALMKKMEKLEKDYSLDDWYKENTDGDISNISYEIELVLTHLELFKKLAAIDEKLRKTAGIAFEKSADWLFAKPAKWLLNWSKKDVPENSQVALANQYAYEVADNMPKTVRKFFTGM